MSDEGRETVDTEKLAAKLAPLEEREGKAHEPGLYDAGAIGVGSESLKLSKGLIDEQERPLFARPAPVVVFLFCAVLAFILFIAYLVSLMPPKP